MVNRTGLTRQCAMFTNKGTNHIGGKKQSHSEQLKGRGSCMGDNRNRWRHSKGHFSRRKKSMISPDLKHYVDYLRSLDDLGHGQLFTHTPPVPLRPTTLNPELITRRSITEGEHKLMLQKQFVNHNAALLSIACLGALLLMSVNLVGILCCKGYFKKKAKPIPVVATYPRRHTSFFSRRHFTNLRKYSLEGNIEAASVIDEIRERNIRDDPILGKYPNLGVAANNRPVTISCGTIYGVRQQQQPHIKVTTSGIEMAEVDTFGVNIEDLEVDGSHIGSRPTVTWKDKLRKFSIRRKSFREKTEKANTTGYFC